MSRQRGGLSVEPAGWGGRKENLGFGILCFQLASPWLMERSKAQSKHPFGFCICFIPLP